VIVKIYDICGDFAENKDQARVVREKIKSQLSPGDDKVILDFSKVDSTTQSFIHALISEFFQKNGESALELFEFKKCSKPVKSLITTVVNYSLE